MEAETENTALSFVPDRENEILRATTDIVCSAIGSGRWDMKDIAGLIPEIHAAIKAALAGTGPQADGAIAPAPQFPENAELPPTPRAAEEIAASITDEHLISFEDGKAYKTLKRSLTTRGLTPESYRAKWGLPKDYPMVAPNYAAQRSALAKSIGLGRRDQPEAELSR